MKLKECTYGMLVIDSDQKVGHIVGVTYNCNLSHTGGMSNEDKFDRTIPLVQFPDGTRGIHHSNIDKF